MIILIGVYANIVVSALKYALKNSKTITIDGWINMILYNYNTEKKLHNMSKTAKNKKHTFFYEWIDFKKCFRLSE